MQNDSPAERRRHQRYLPNGDIFVTFRPGFDKIGPLKDLSEGGIAFEYTAFYSSCGPDCPDVDIFASSIGFHLTRVPCKIVYDRSKEQQGFLGIETRRCGLEFRDLTHEQATQVQFLLGNCSPEALSTNCHRA